MTALFFLRVHGLVSPLCRPAAAHLEFPMDMKLLQDFFSPAIKSAVVQGPQWMFLSYISKCTFPYQLADYELHPLEVYELCGGKYTEVIVAPINDK